MTFSLFRLYQYSTECKDDVKFGVLYSFLNKLFDIAPELLIGIAVDLVVRKENSLIAEIGITTPKAQLFFLGMLTLIIWSFESLFQYLYGIKWKTVAQKLQHQLRIDSYAHIQKLDMEWLQKTPIGKIQTILNDDINQLERFINHGFNDIVQIFSSTLLIGVIFVYLSPLLAIGTVLPIPFILFGVFYFQKKIQPLYLKVREQASLIGSRIENNLTGISVIKSYTAEKFQHKQLTRDSLNYQSANQKAIRISSAFIPLIRIIILAGFMFTLILGGWMTMNQTLPIGSYSALVFLTQRFLWPFTSLGQVIDNFSRAKSSAIRVFNLLDTKITVEKDQQNTNNPFNLESSLNLNNINFSYTSKHSVFNEFNMTIPKNQMIAIVGPTGSGKSTLVKLLLRFYKIQKGDILIDKKSIYNLPITTLRKLIAYVSQDVFIFPGTIEQNIAFGDPHPNKTRLLTASKQAKAHTFIETLPQAYQTKIGEKGYRLSGGQRQRISIARALYKNSPILIFDEATSNIDNHTEILIRQALEEVSKHKTTIIIAHRLSTIIHADTIYILNQGKIIGQGTHNQLLKNNSYYQHLWSLQTGCP